jgi:hypothetical protein
MFKKLFLIGLFIGLIALLVVGAVNRTMAKSGSEGSSQDRTGLASDLHSSDLPAQAGLAEIVPPEEGYGWGRGRQVTGAAGSEQDTGSAATPPGQGRAAANEAAGTHEFFASGAYTITEAD